jgi:hypothetical protein
MSDSAMEDIVMSGISPSPLLAMPAEIQLQILRYLLSTSHNRKAARRPVDAPCNHHLEDILSDPAGQNSTDAVMRLFHPVASSTSGVEGCFELLSRGAGVANLFKTLRCRLQSVV